MKGKPFLVAVAAFVVVLFGGVAVAGVGSMGSATDVSATTASVAEFTPSTTPQEQRDKDTSLEAEAKAEAEAEAREKAEKEETKAKEKAEAEAKEKAEKEEAKAKEEPKSDDKEKDTTTVLDLFSLLKPADGTHFDKKVVTFGGEASDGVTIHRGKYSTGANGGTWSMELVLSPGKNKVAFKATDGAGHIDTAVVTVYYDAPKEEEKPKEEDKPKDVAFSAHQKYGSCGEEVPYDVFWGTAKPGAKIEASSPYGSNTTKANDKGHWEMKVRFPDAPQGETFKVRINSSDGGSQKFAFTNTGGGKDH